MDGDNLYDKVYEVKKEINVGNTMQLIDLNGTKKNFSSEFIFQTEDPSKKVNICVLNQDELDNGIINFEESHRGKYSKRITFQSPRNEHVNHYIAVKKHKEDQDETPVKSYLVIHMKELPPLPQSPSHEESDDIGNIGNVALNSNQDFEEENTTNNINNKNISLNPNMSQNTRKSLKQKLNNLRTDDQYKKLKNGIENVEEDDDIILDEDEDENESFQKEKLKLLNERKKRELYTNSYFIIGILLLALFACLFYMKKIRK